MNVSGAVTLSLSIISFPVLSTTLGKRSAELSRTGWKRAENGSGIPASYYTPTCLAWDDAAMTFSSASCSAAFLDSTTIQCVVRSPPPPFHPLQAIILSMRY